MAEERDDDCFYALKLFALRDPDQRTMLVRELKLLCAFRCDCLVEMEGAFLDLKDDNHRNDRIHEDGEAGMVVVAGRTTGTAWIGEYSHTCVGVHGSWQSRRSTPCCCR